MHELRPSDIALPPTEPIDITALIREALAQHQPKQDEAS